jgi:hypothetical protein
VNAITHSRWLIFGVLCLGVASPLPALAEADEPLATESIAESVAELGIAEFVGEAVVDVAALEYTRGGTDLYLNEIKSDGVVTNNQAYNLTTGSNWITDGSLAGASGFPTVVQNSGNNVLIQNATIINLQVQ